MRKILITLSIVIVTISFTGWWQLRYGGADEMQLKFEVKYPKYEVKDLYNLRGFGSGREYVVEYEYEGEKYRGWLDPDGTINEQEKLED